MEVTNLVVENEIDKLIDLPEEWHVDKNVLSKVLTTLGAEDPESVLDDDQMVRVIERVINDEHFPDYFGAVEARRQFEDRNPDFGKYFKGTSKDVFDNFTPENLNDENFLELIDIEAKIIEAKVKFIHGKELPMELKLNLIWSLKIAYAYAIETKMLFDPVQIR